MYYSEVLGRSVVHYFDHVAYLTISAVPVVLLDALGISLRWWTPGPVTSSRDALIGGWVRGQIVLQGQRRFSRGWRSPTSNYVDRRSTRCLCQISEDIFQKGRLQ